MNRREFITLLGGAAAAWPLDARAQQPMPVVGFLHAGSAAASSSQVIAFHAGLNENGFVDGSNVTVDVRWAEGHYDRLASLMTDLKAETTLPCSDRGRTRRRARRQGWSRKHAYRVRQRR